MGGEADGGSVKYEPQKSHHPYILCHFERDVLGSVSGGDKQRSGTSFESDCSTVLRHHKDMSKPRLHPVSESDSRT